MQTKISITGIPARDKALKGAEYVASSVKSTIGPFGLNALIEKGNRITNDGFTISQELCGSIEDEFERRGAVTIHEASSRTNDQVGDATSSSEALAIEITKEAVRLLPNEKTLIAKKTPSEIIRMINEAKDTVINKLQASVVKITDEKTLIKSALVSVEDEELAKLLGSTQWKLGEDGFIIAEETADSQSSIEIVKGIRLDNGFGTSLVVNNQEKGSLELSDISVLLTNYVLQAEDILKFKETVFKPLISQKRTTIAIIARAFSSEAIQLCMESAKSGFFIYPINAPYVNQTQIMKDLEVVLGGRYIDTEESRLEDIFVTDIGFCKRLVARSNDAIVTGEDDDKSQQRITKRVQELKAKITGSSSEFEKKSLQSRISQLTSGFAILKVGAQSVAERKYKKDKADDAVNAVRLALKGGTVKGAGIALREVSDTLDDSCILKRPIRVINDQIMSSAPKDWKVEEWVRDPFLVIKCALENACSVAATLASVNIVIATENPKKKYEEDTE